MTNSIDALEWRYATKAYDTEKKLSAEQIDTMLEAARLAPSSYGLQPWKFIVVNNPEMRAKLREAGYGQSPITDASHFIVIAVPSVIDDTLIDAYLQSVAHTRGVSLESLAGYRAMNKGALENKTPAERIEWAARQAYLALGVLLTTAAVERIDATPMEGFDPKKFDEILGLVALGLESKVALALGFRSSEDAMAGAIKVRFPKSEVVVEVN